MVAISRLAHNQTDEVTETLSQGQLVYVISEGNHRLDIKCETNPPFFHSKHEYYVLIIPCLQK